MSCKAARKPSLKRALVQKRIDQINTQLASYETIKKFALIGEPLTVEAELLTPSLKIRRKKIYDRFRDVFEGLYDDTRPAAAANGQNGSKGTKVAEA